MGRKIKLYIAIAAISFLQGLELALTPVMSGVTAFYSNIDESLVQMLVTIPAFVSILASIVSGWLVVKFSKKKLLIFSAILALVTGFIPFLNSSFILLFAMRALYGITLGFAASLNTAVVSEFFQGDERVTAMGVQAATVGAGYLLVQSISGIIGKNDFHMSYFIYLIAFLSLVLLVFFLPDTGKSVPTKSEKVKLTAGMIPICIFGFIEMMMMISYSTNISQHLAAYYAGHDSAASVVTSVFSIAQILIGLVLGYITKITKRLVLPVAMLSFAVGAIILVLFPSSYPMLIIGSLFVGFSQGIYVPSAFVDVSNAVPMIAVALASAFFNAACCVGKTVSPYVLNTLSRWFTGSVNTKAVFLIGAVIMIIAAVIQAVMKLTEKKKV